MTMRVLVLWADDSSPNLGVRALGRGTAALVRSTWPDATIEFHNYGHRAPELPVGRIRSLARERVTGRLGMQRRLASFDLVIDTRSGDSFSDIYGLQRLAVMSMVAEFASQARVPVVMGPQTIGPFTTARGRLLARASLGRARLVLARDPESVVRGDRLGRRMPLLTTDVVFALPVPVVERSRDVVLNVSGLLWARNPHVDADRYRATMARLCRSLSARGRRVALLAHVLASPNPDNDMVAIGDLVPTLGDIEVIVPSGVDEVREAVASATVVVGSRMHACLNAISVGTPAVAVAYSRKFEPLLHGLGWDHTVDLAAGDAVARVLLELECPTFDDELTGVAERARRLVAVARDAIAEAP